jgi:pimeloyl-ACP methyl ester carboxylesterase
MPTETINGVNIFLEEFGSGDPLVLVHGSWVDHMEWPFVVPLLSPRFRVVVYDRRGHSQSERLPAQGSVREDVADLAAIIERTGAPAHVVGSSFGASISLRRQPGGGAHPHTQPARAALLSFCSMIRSSSR